jgi:translation initiation factor IF-3
MKRFNKKQEPRIPINHYIKYPEVRVTGSDGEQLGIMSKDRAVGLAKDQGLDLVLVTERADPPVCKIIEFGKHQYEQKKREKERAKQARANRVDIHEIQFRPMIGQGDMDVKFKKIREFIEDGDKVKIMIRFRGREMAHKDNGFAICDKILSSIENSEWETKPSFAGNRLLGVLKRASK